MLLSPLRKLAYIGEEFVCAVAVIGHVWSALFRLPPANSIVPLSGVCTPFVMHVFLPLATHRASRRSWSRAAPSK